MNLLATRQTVLYENIERGDVLAIQIFSYNVEIDKRYRINTMYFFIQDIGINNQNPEQLTFEAVNRIETKIGNALRGLLSQSATFSKMEIRLLKPSYICDAEGKESDLQAKLNSPVYEYNQLQQNLKYVFNYQTNIIGYLESSKSTSLQLQMLAQNKQQKAFSRTTLHNCGLIDKKSFVEYKANIDTLINLFTTTFVDERFFHLEPCILKENHIFTQINSAFLIPRY